MRPSMYCCFSCRSTQDAVPAQQLGGPHAASPAPDSCRKLCAGPSAAPAQHYVIPCACACTRADILPCACTCAERRPAEPSSCRTAAAAAGRQRQDCAPAAAAACAGQDTILVSSSFRRWQQPCSSRIRPQAQQDRGGECNGRSVRRGGRPQSSSWAAAAASNTAAASDASCSSRRHFPARHAVHADLIRFSTPPAHAAAAPTECSSRRRTGAVGRTLLRPQPYRCCCCCCW
jgi:hypothetical protein